MAFLFFEGSAAQNNAFINQAVIADFGCLSNHHTHSMVDKRVAFRSWRQDGFQFL
jgi:hypothetical protein